MRKPTRWIAMLLSFVMVLGLLPAVSMADDAENGLVLHYDFQSLENGTIVEDISGNGKAGEVMPRGSGVQTQQVEIYGQPKTAIVIAGGSPSEGHNYVEMPVGVLNDLESVTISCWVYINQTVSYGRIWDLGSNTTSYMYLLDAGANSGHRGYTTAITGSGWSNEIGPEKGSNLATRTWKLTTVTFNGATNEISLYEDGEKIGTSTAAVDLSRLQGTTQNWIGYGQFKDNLLNGMIADFRIYNYAMSDAEVASLFDIPDDDRVQRDYNSLRLGSTSNLETNLRLPAAGAAGSSIEWTTSDPGVITADGVITRPAPGMENSAATLTARIFYGEAEMTKTFSVTVQAMPTDEERVIYDTNAIDLGSLNAVTENLSLPTAGVKGSDIAWNSSDPQHLSETGKVTRPVGEPVTVTLTALVSYGAASRTREFALTILPVYEKLDAIRAEKVAVTTKAGIAPALPAVVLTTFEDGSRRMVKVTWPTNLSGASFAAAGEYPVNGRLVDFDVDVAATVTVVDELPTPDAEASMLKLSDVTLDGNDTIYGQNMGRALEYLKVMNADRMLYNFRRTFGQDTKGAQALSGWDEPTGLLRGHSTGHFMSALAEAYASTDDEVYKEKLDYMIDSMRELQLLSKGKASDFVTACSPSDAAQSKWSTDPSTWGAGFISAYSPDQFALLEQYTPYATIWAPYYTMHKLLAGFLDSYVYAGNETGLEIAKDLGLWVYDRLSACTPEQRTRMWSMYIAGEYGGMNEVLARLYEITGDERLLIASRMFDNTTFFDGLAENRDTIQTRHANQHIPQIVGAIHEYAATGDPYYYSVARNFWEMATARYAYSIGGVGTGESFKQPYRQGNNINGNSSRGENCETCAAYNMLKLTRDIYVYDPDNAAYMDYYERTVLNQIAASQSHNSTNSMHNGCTYMLPIDPGQRKTYDSDYGGFTCCNGTGMENHVIYQIAAYAKTDDTLYVNLYMPSTAEWEEKNITVKQETRFPSEDSKLTVTGSGSFKMKIRVPYWATAGFTVKVNGETVCTNPTPSSYVEIDRTWADGDVVDIHMPYTLHLDKTPDTVGGSVVASLMYGPIVMVARDNRSSYTAMNWYELSLNDTNLEEAVSIVEPAGTGKVPHFAVEGLDFYPMYDAYNYRYHAYVKLMDGESVLNPEYLQRAVDAVSGENALTEANFDGEDWSDFQTALTAAHTMLEKVPDVTQEALFDAQVALEEAAAKSHEPADGLGELVKEAKALAEEALATAEAARQAAGEAVQSTAADREAAEAAQKAAEDAQQKAEAARKAAEAAQAAADAADADAAKQAAEAARQAAEAAEKAAETAKAQAAAQAAQEKAEAAQKAAEDAQKAAEEAEQAAGADKEAAEAARKAAEDAQKQAEAAKKAAEDAKQAADAANAAAAEAARQAAADAAKVAETLAQAAERIAKSVDAAEAARKAAEGAKALAEEAQAAAEAAKQAAAEAAASAAEDKEAAQAAQKAAEEAQKKAEAAQKAAEDAQAAADAADAEAAKQASEAARQASEAAEKAAETAKAQAAAQAAQEKAEAAQKAAEAAQKSAEEAEQAAGQDKAAADAAREAAEAARKLAEAAQKAAEAAKQAADAANAAAAEAAKQAAADAAKVAEALARTAELVAQTAEDKATAEKAAKEAKDAALTAEKTNAKVQASIVALGVDPDTLSPENQKKLDQIMEDAISAIDDAEDAEAVQKALDEAVKAIEGLEELFRFDDVKDASAYYFDPVYWAYFHDPQITTGTSANLFSPGMGCTRAQVVTFLWRAAGEPAPKNADTGFSDVPAGQWYSKAVAWAVENEITKGTGEGKFSPDRTCTRREIVTFLWRANGEPKAKSGKNPFTDVPEGQFYTDAVLWAVEKGVTKGTSDTGFSPAKVCSRAEIVTFLYRDKAE